MELRTCTLDIAVAADLAHERVRGRRGELGRVFLAPKPDDPKVIITRSQ